MDRTQDKTILDEFVEEFVDIVEKHCKYIIVSGYVAIAHGRTRGTEDIDMIIERIPKQKFLKLHEDLEKSGFECVQTNKPRKIYDEYLKQNVSVRYVWKNKMLPEMEIKLAKDELDEYQLETRKKYSMTEIDAYFSTIEMNIAFKEELLKSQKDLEDAKHLRKIYEEQLDEREIENIKEKIKRLRL